MPQDNHKKLHHSDHGDRQHLTSFNKIVVSVLLEIKEDVEQLMYN